MKTVFDNSYTGNQASAIDEIEDSWERTFCKSCENCEIKHPISVEKLSRLLLAVREAVLNAMEHGCCLKPSPLWVKAICEDGKITIEVTDSGPGIPPESLAMNIDGKVLSERGRGLLFIKNLSEKVEAKAATLIMSFHLH